LHLSSLKLLYCVLIGLGILLAPGVSQAASACENYFSGERVTLVVPFSAGGGNDAYARLFAPVLAALIDSRVVVRNIPGAGGMIGASTVAAAEPDSLVMGVFDPVNLIAAKLSSQDAPELSRFSFLGAFNIDATVWAGRAASLESLAQTGTIVVGQSSYSMISRILLPAVALGWSVESVSGYSGTADAWLAMLRGETDIAYSPAVVMRNYLDANSDASVLLSLSKGPNVLFPVAPYLGGPGGLVERLSAGLDEEVRQRRLNYGELAVELNQSFRAIAITSGISAETMACLTQAVHQVLISDQLQRVAEQQNLILQPVSGADISATLQRINDLVLENITEIQTLADVWTR